ncbi:MAG: hypothetical protein NT003_04740 [Candidatus Magasanikbacteria bacterium]|nr:hypothetical protein [Candidatus Magasanikbacteria bacterium]
MKRFTNIFTRSLLSLVLIAGVFGLRAAPVYADSFGLEATRNQTQFKSSQQSLPQLIGTVISIALSLIGFVFLGLAMYAGFKWMTAGGESKDVGLARDTLINASIGAVLIVGAYALTNFLFTDVIGKIQ